MNNNETLADIVKEMRLGSTGGLPCAYRIGRPNRTREHIQIDSVTVADLADRIEAAVVRLVREERTEAIDEALAHAEDAHAAKCRNCTERVPGNMAVMRKALEESRDFALQIERATIEADVGYDAGEIVETCEEALKSPPRNCDVGTAEEQVARFKKFCYSTGISCRGCPIRDKVSEDNPCYFTWMAEPYKEEGAE